MKTVNITVIFILLCVCASAQIDTARMILGDWFYNDGDKFNLEVDQVIIFSRLHTSDSLYLQWTFTDDQQFVRSGIYKSPEKDYPIGYKSNPVKYHFSNGKGIVLISRTAYEIVTIDEKILTIKRIE